MLESSNPWEWCRNLYIFISRYGYLNLLKERRFRDGSDDKMRKMWLWQEIGVVSLPPLLILCGQPWGFNYVHFKTMKYPYLVDKHQTIRFISSRKNNQVRSKKWSSQDPERARYQDLESEDIKI